MHKVIFLVAAFLFLSGCASSYPVFEYQATEIQQARPDTLDEFYSMILEKAGENQIHFIENENAVAIAVFGVDALKRMEWTLKSICEKQMQREATALSEKSYPTVLGAPNSVLGVLPVDLFPTWKQHDTWLEEKLPGKFFSDFDASVQGVCLKHKRLGIAFAYSSVLLLGNKTDTSSRHMMLLITPEEHYAEAIALAKTEPTLRLVQAIILGDIQEVKSAIKDGARVNEILMAYSMHRPLALALKSNDLEMLTLLVDAGARINSTRPLEIAFIGSNILSGNINTETVTFIMNNERLNESSGKLMDYLAKEIQKTDEDRRREDQQIMGPLLDSWRTRPGTQVCRSLDGVIAKGIVIDSDIDDVRVRVTEIIQRPGRVVYFKPDSSIFSTERWRTSDLWKPC